MWRDTMMWHFSFIELDDVAEVCVTTKVTMKSNIYTPFPQTKWFVVRWRHESAVVVNEGDRIDSPQMTVVFLCDLARPCVPLKENQLRCSHDCTKLWRCSVNKHTAVLHEYTITGIFTFKVQWVLLHEDFYIYVASKDHNFFELTQTIFLSDVPATKKSCLSSSGWNFTQYGIFLFVKREMHSPAGQKCYLGKTWKPFYTK